MAEMYKADADDTAAQEFTPPPVFFDRLERLRTAIALGTPDRVPVCLGFDSFAARTTGIRLSELAHDADVAGAAVLETLEKLGDVDALQFATNLPKLLGMIWLTPVQLPGDELPEDTLWQLDEQARIQPEDYDRILEVGWSPWLGEYIGKYLKDEAAANEVIMNAGPRWAREDMKHGYVSFTTANVVVPFEQVSGGRSVKDFILDLYRMPDKVQAILDIVMEERMEETRHMVRTIGPFGYQIGSWRTAPEFLAPKLWERFAWPYIKKLTETVVEEGGVPILHFDANWDREIERLLELPKAKCILTLDGKTDIFRAKKILDGHMCLMGDVPPGLLSLGSVEEVKGYCRRLLDELGPSGYIMAQGCAIPPDAKFENVKAMVDSVQA